MPPRRSNAIGNKGGRPDLTEIHGSARRSKELYNLRDTRSSSRSAWRGYYRDIGPADSLARYGLSIAGPPDWG